LTTSTFDPVRIGIVGLGRLGKLHAENLMSRVPGAILVAAADPAAAERDWAQTLGVANVYEDLSALLAHPDLEAVWLVTPTTLHADQIITVLEAGKHVFCEKPLALDVADCERVIAVARQRPAQVAMVGFMRRFDPGNVETKRLLDTSELGEPFHIHLDSHDPVDPNGYFVRYAPTSGGLFLDCAIHDADLLRWLLDDAEPVRVTAAGSRRMYPDLAACDDIDTGVVTIEYDTGVIGTISVSRTSHRGYEAALHVHGTRGAVRVGYGLSPLPVVRDGGDARHTAGLPDFYARFDDAFLRETEAFVTAVRKGTPSPLTLEDAREATRLAVAMRDALQQHATLSLPLRASNKISGSAGSK
jgi:myo-inositol 2-dehydrogenase / D-chiro-inositol 1-dehydrogenase